MLESRNVLGLCLNVFEENYKQNKNKNTLFLIVSFLINFQKTNLFRSILFA